uniref:RNase H domain-containing protein n=1 Tax=Caenorhabditis japonica TaxID=281687 RepID=A0A8R1HTE9_CAEJA
MTLVAGEVSIARSRRLSATVATCQRQSRPDSTKIGISEGEQAELNFWEENLARLSITEMEDNFSPKWFAFTDASAKGMGAILKTAEGAVKLKTSKIGNAEFEKESSALRELRAVKLLSSVMKNWIKGDVLVHLDSQAAVSVLKRGSMKRDLQELAEKVWIDLNSVGNARFVWIQRDLNVEADEISRDFDFDDWSVRDHVFTYAQKRWGTVQCDWFADENNKKMEIFFPGSLREIQGDQTFSRTSTKLPNTDWHGGFRLPI